MNRFKNNIFIFMLLMVSAADNSNSTASVYEVDIKRDFIIKKVHI